MKTVENAALEYGYSNLLSSNDNKRRKILAFKKGLEFAQRWIPIEEELPENTHLFDEPNFELIRFLVKGRNGKEWVANRKHQKDDSIIPYSFFSCETGRYYSVTRWRQIKLK